ncbi:hypothetical protein CO731_01522 [Aminobacter sp. MSH1]|uniref:Small integral membrane protein n=1 Tax=Aminobacter niigataensis TaxID=83265 RepID=A0ABR6L1J3_9HYPH|nr:MULTISPECIES: DUF2165 domain-containing protein [Aminobacter]AWC22066.1 hypothetical protein CO731_01522 [Aminobacter sp. MSH1]MBB4650503.1 putative small integral membrane protein [Aminobacter niigataensis]
MNARITKIGMCFSLAAFTLLVVFNNITDYGSNYNFVRHVLSMDTTFPGNALMYRAITAETLWHLGYWLIIAGEAVACVLFALSAWALFRARNGTAASFNKAKSKVHAAAGVGFMVWFFGFMVVGGQWFVMWQSDSWNGQDAAFRFYTAIIGVLIYVTMPDGELE